MMAVGRFPYDVSKSGAELIAFSYFQTYGTPVAITFVLRLAPPSSGSDWLQADVFADT